MTFTLLINRNMALEAGDHKLLLSPFIECPTKSKQNIEQRQLREYEGKLRTTSKRRQRY